MYKAQENKKEKIIFTKVMRISMRCNGTFSACLSAKLPNTIWKMSTARYLTALKIPISVPEKPFASKSGVVNAIATAASVQYPPCKKQYFTVILRFIPTAPFVNKDTVFPINSMSFQCPFLSPCSNTHSPSRHLKSAYRRHWP